MVNLHRAIVVTAAAAALGGTAALIARIKGGKSTTFKVIIPPTSLVKTA